MIAGLLLDLDDTLYDYVPAERAASERVVGLVAKYLGREPGEVTRALREAKRVVKARVGNVASAHSRLAYLVELVHRMGRPEALVRVRGWERAYWETFLANAQLRPSAHRMLDGWRALGHKVAIVTNLGLEIQLWKMEHFQLCTRVDALVVSEEVAVEKPAKEAFLLAAERLGVPIETCVVVGDSPDSDGAGARALGLRYLQAYSSERGTGLSLEDIAVALRIPA